MSKLPVNTTYGSSPYAVTTTHSYIISSSDMTDISNWIFSATSLEDAVNRLFESPGDALISTVVFPFNLLTVLGISGNKTGVRFGNTFSAGNGYDIGGDLTAPSKLTFVAAVGTVENPSANANYPFMDYPPYTTCKLYVPFCGWVDIDYAAYHGEILTLYYSLNPFNGSCIAYICTTTNIITTISGQMGIKVDLNSSNAGTSALQGALNAVTGAISVVATAAGGAGTGAILTGVLNTAGNVQKSGKYETTPGGVSSGASFNQPTTPFFLFKSSTTKTDPATYVNDQGRPANVPGLIKNLASEGSFAIFEGVRIAPTESMTQTEYDMIISLLGGGVYV